MSLDLDKSTWKRVAFGDVIENVTVRVDNPSAAGVGRYVGLEHLDPGVMTVQRWDSPDKVEAQKLRFQPGDVIFGRRRAYQKKVARADFEGICSAHALVLRARPDAMVSDFLPLFLASDYFLDRAISISVGSLSPTVNWRDLKVQEFDLPPLDEQQRIADLLWAVEREREDASALRAALAAVRGAVIDDRFIQAGAGRLQDLCDSDGIRIGPFGAQLHAYDYVEDGPCPVVMPQDMVNCAISTSNIQRTTKERANELSAHRLRAGDILLPRRGELDRRALVTKTEEGWLCGTGSVRIRLSAGVPTRAVFLALSSSTTVEWLKASATGTTMPNLNAGIVSRIPISLPSDEKVVAALREIDLLDSGLAAAENRLSTVDVLRRTLFGDVFGSVE
jgi:type I restriction enzyme, S subunit